jgi:hypothetical protein
MPDLEAEFGQIDICRFDAASAASGPARHARARAGCGSGRNAVYLMRAGHEVCAADADRAARGACRYTVHIQINR